ncbi:MAG TPA: LysR family transcriptional regulator [Candidatus Bariatricus faecipullorum]|nr:LysR family transcriptional regulator [Candidatus Bariatricus faecipullorum]
MEIRVLKYFLMAAREENITRAAGLLHVTQPTLSRQLMQLEEELGVKLFHRGKYHITLTDDGMLLKRRAQEIIDLVEKTEQEFSQDEGELTGEIAFGCGETRNMTFLSRRMASFRELYPQVHYRIYSTTAEEIKERIEKGILDMGLLTEPVDIGKYEFVRMKEKEQWGVLVRQDDPLAALAEVTPRELEKVPLLLPWREEVQNELANWFGDSFDRTDIAGHYNLILNAANMVENRVGAAFCFRMDNEYQNLKFVPLSPRLETGTVLAWKKNQMFSAAASAFIQYVKHSV